MPKRGLCHVELNVPDYERALDFYDRMFSWLGYRSFSTLGIEYVGTYYFAFPHSYIGIQPGGNSEPYDHELRRIGLNHVSLWARSRKEVGRFYEEFLRPEGLRVLDPPDFCPDYAPTYYAVFFLDPFGIRWELTYMPMLPSPFAAWRWWRRMARIKQEHPQWKRHPFFEAQRNLPCRP